MKLSFLFASAIMAFTLMWGSSGKAEKGAPIVFRVERGGIAGTNGYEWVLNPDGTWNEYSFLKSAKLNRRDKVQSGKLNPEELAKLRDTIQTAGFEKLPEKIGEAAKVNAQQITLEVGKKKVQLLDTSTRGKHDISSQIESQVAEGKQLPEQKQSFVKVVKAFEGSIRHNDKVLKKE